MNGNFRHPKIRLLRDRLLVLLIILILPGPCISESYIKKNYKKKNNSICCKIFKLWLTILGHYALKVNIRSKIWRGYLSLHFSNSVIYILIECLQKHRRVREKFKKWARASITGIIRPNSVRRNNSHLDLLLISSKILQEFLFYEVTDYYYIVIWK